MSKHILLYTDDPGLGGVAHYNHSLLCGLAALGYQLTCVQSKISDPLVSHRNKLGVQHLWLEFDTSKDFDRTLTNSADAQEILSSVRPDLIIFSDTWPLANFAAKQAAIHLGIPYIVVVGFVAPYPGGLPAKYLDELSRRYDRAKAAIAVSIENLSLLHQLFGLPKEKGQVIYYGRAAQYFNPPQKLVRDRLRQEFDIPSDAVVCFTSARLDPIKGYQYQLAAIEQLKQSHVWPLLYFVWAGAGKLEAQLREAVNQLGVTNQVKLLGQRWDIPDWLDASDIFVLPSVSEGMPLAIMEAMAKGLPVIASAVSGVPEELGDTGKLLPDPKVDPQATVEELVATIQAWCASPELRDSNGQAGKIRAEQLFTEERMIEETVEVIEHALLPVGDYAPSLSINREPIQRTLLHVEDRLLVGGARSVNKKALVFFPHNPYPPQTGAHQRCLSMLSGLKELGYDVTLFGSTLITDSPWHFDNIKDLQNDLGINVEVYQGTQGDREFMAQMSATSKGLANWDIYTPPRLHERFRQLFAQLAPDVVVINYALWGGLAIGEEFKSAVRIIETHDLITLNIQKRQALGRYLTTVPFTPEQIDPSLVDEDFFSKLQLDATPEEYWIYDQYDYTIAIAPREAQVIREHTHRTRVEYVPMMFTTEPLNNTYTGEPLFVVGPNPFNVQGYLYFTTKVLPAILRQLPEFSLRVVGSTCQQLVPVDGIQLLGFVPDLKPLYSESRFAVCPLIGGTGQQVKIVEAMAHGIPVIALQNVAESSPIQHGINGFIAENAEEFAKYTIQLFHNPELCRQMGQAARETIAENFSKHALVEKLDFLEPEKLENQNIRIEKISPTIIVDGVFFQLYRTGIGRVWRSLLEEWAENGFAKHIIVLDRAGTAPKIPGIWYRPMPSYDYERTDADREMLQQVCDEEGADLFISSYYTTPLSTPSVFLAHDMIPELMGWNLNHPMWREKHYGIQHATAYIAVSENTARDLVIFFPHISLESVTVAQNGVNHKTFSPVSPEDINRFKTKYGISKPYFILVGTGGYKNTVLFFKAFAQLYSKHGFEIVCTGSSSLSEADFKNYTSGSVVHRLQLSDEELSAAYSGAIALVYPSKYEGFGLPILEAIACGCPVITCPNASIPEVAGEAALYVNDDDVDELANALCDVQKPDIRNSLIAAGLKQAKKFSWAKMASTVSSALITATLLPLNLKDINLIVFPDWSRSEESLCFELEQVIRAIATHPDASQMTLLVDNGNIPDEDAALILSSVSMNLLLQEDLDISEGPEISLVGQLSEMQWEALLPRIHARIVLENENQEAIARFKPENIPLRKLDSLLPSLR